MTRMLASKQLRLRNRGGATHPVLRTALLAAASAALMACGDYGGGTGGGGGGGPVTFASTNGGGGGASRTEMVSAFSTTVYPIVEQYCQDCHAGAGPGTPHIAHPDLDTAYSNTMGTQKVNLANPDTSRLVRRLATDFHHCWSNCMNDAAEMSAAITAWAAAVAFDENAGEQVESLASGSLSLGDGVEDEGDERYSRNQIALWQFKEGEGNVAYDTSGVEPAMDLTLEGPTFLGGYGITIEDGRAIASAISSNKLFDRIAAPQKGSQQYSVEAWVFPANTDQEGPARIISYSNGTGERNFTLGQVLYNYNYRNRSLEDDIDDNGLPALQTRDADEDLQDVLHHVVVTFDQFRGRRIYVNGEWTEDVDLQRPGRLWNWDPGHEFVLGNETSNDRQWEGQIRLVAIYDAVLSDAQILQNFQAGVGKRLLMRFDVSQWLGAGAYVEFTVTEWDDYSYLFCSPTLVSSGQNGVRVANLRVSVNGQVPLAGQAFQTVDVPLTEDRQVLSGNCSVISKELGPDSDVFAIEFEVLGGFENPVIVDFPAPPPLDVFGDPLPVEGMRDFARINETMAAVTGVDPNSPGPRDAFDELTQQLPPSFDLRSFNSSHQVAIAKLGFQYCDELAETPALRGAFFPAVNFANPTTDVFSVANRDLVIQPLVEKSFGDAVVNQPTMQEVATILDTVIDQMLGVCTPQTPCGMDRTLEITKATCGAVLSSAGLTIH